MPRPYPIMGFLALILFLTGMLLLTAAGCGKKEVASPPLTPAASVANGFVGNEACKGCHPSEFHRHSATRHQATLRPADTKSLGDQAPHPGPIPGTPYHIEAHGETLIYARRKPTPKAEPIQFVLGSGKTGVTYVTVVNDTSLREMRMSYFPKRKLWHITPGQEWDMNDELGTLHGKDLARKCLGCHVSTLPEQKTTPEARFYGVGCEACHGPGKAHVEAMRAGDKAHLNIERMGTWGATRLNEFCGKCHRTAKDIDLTSKDAGLTQSFQPYGLMLSPCFQMSSDRLSCLTCHDPHADASTDQKGYEAACLRCHASDTAPPPADRPKATPIMASKPCPVNPRTGCIPCHMPQRRVMSISKIPTTMADHLIWAYRKKR